MELTRRGLFASIAAGVAALYVKPKISQPKLPIDPAAIEGYVKICMLQASQTFGDQLDLCWAYGVEPVQVWPEPQYYQIRGDAGYCLGPLLTSERWNGTD